MPMLQSHPPPNPAQQSQVGACNPDVPPPLVTAGFQLVPASTQTFSRLQPSQLILVILGTLMHDEEAGKDVGEALRGG